MDSFWIVAEKKNSKDSKGYTIKVLQITTQVCIVGANVKEEQILDGNEKIQAEEKIEKQ